MKFALIAITVATVIAGSASTAHAGSVALTLAKITRENVEDVAGRWQHEGGDILKAGVKVGSYLLQRRVINGVSDGPVNSGATTITLLLSNQGGTAPHNITLQGAHSFDAGNFRGSVSGASNRYTFTQGGDASYSYVVASGHLSLVISWNGSSQLTVP